MRGHARPKHALSRFTLRPWRLSPPSGHRRHAQAGLGSPRCDAGEAVVAGRLLRGKQLHGIAVPSMPLDWSTPPSKSGRRCAVLPGSVIEDGGDAG